MHNCGEIQVPECAVAQTVMELILDWHVIVLDLTLAYFDIQRTTWLCHRLQGA